MNNTITNKYFNEISERFTRKNKKKFQQAIIEDFAKLGYSGEVDSQKKGFGKVENIYIGNVKQAKTVIAVPYDTPAKVFWFNNHHYPLNGYENLRRMFIPLYAPILITWAVILFLIYGIPAITGDKNNFVLALLAFVALVLLMVLLFVGFPNKRNIIRNSTSVAMAYAIAEQLHKDHAHEVLFVFTDSSKKFVGSEALQKYLNDHKKNTMGVIVLYCIGSGNLVGINADKITKNMAKDMLKGYKGDLKIKVNNIENSDKDNTLAQGLNRVMEISSGYERNGFLVVENTATGKDNAVDDMLADEVAQMLVTYLNARK